MAKNSPPRVIDSLTNTDRICDHTHTHSYATMRYKFWEDGMTAESSPPNLLSCHRDVGIRLRLNAIEQRAVNPEASGSTSSVAP